jgi:predicted dienelactone hydrolase
MIRVFSYLLLGLIFFISCQPSTSQTKWTDCSIKLEKTIYLDSVRNRQIPIGLYAPTKQISTDKLPLIIISHGYNENRPDSYLSYSFIAKKFTSKGYIVASIQHELPTDSLLDLKGVAQIVRKSNWERGVENILFVIKTLQSTHSNIDFSNVTLIGHSNGGDMSMLFGQKYPDLVKNIISLDNRRVELPRTNAPRIATLRSSDQQADAGVLPTSEEQENYTIKVIQCKDLPHSNMSDEGTKKQQKTINRWLLKLISSL